MKFWDQAGDAGLWSTTTDSFTMSAPTTTLQDLTYTYDAVGNITQIIDRSGTNGKQTTNYAYDNLYRLSGATTTNSTADYTQSYVYDWLGNVTNKSDVGSYTYAGTGYANPDAATAINGATYTYDNAGNVTAAGNTSYVYDYRNRLTYASTSASTTGYTYNFDDSRLTQATKKPGGATTTSTYWNQFYETTGATTTMYIYAGGQLLATVEGNGKATSTNMIHTDHQGGTNVVSSATGTLKQLLSYYPYGDSRLNQQTTTFNSQRKFIGQFADDSTALDYLNARYYSGNTGRFVSEDPISNSIGNVTDGPGYILDTNGGATPYSQYSILSNPQTLNSYGYSLDNPVTKKDPSGKGADPATFVVGFIAGATLQAVSDSNAQLNGSANFGPMWSMSRLATLSSRDFKAGFIGGVSGYLTKGVVDAKGLGVVDKVASIFGTNAAASAGTNVANNEPIDSSRAVLQGAASSIIGPLGAVLDTVLTKPAATAVQVLGDIYAGLVVVPPTSATNQNKNAPVGSTIGPVKRP